MTEDGRTVRENVLIRSGNLMTATEEDLALLSDVYNVKLVVDFRSADGEAELDAVRTMNGVNPAYMERMFDYAGEKSGSMPEFIQEQLGVTDGEIELLRARYLE